MGTDGAHSHVRDPGLCPPPRDDAAASGERDLAAVLLEANQGYRWQRVEIVYAYRPVGGIERLSSELIELRAFDPMDLPDVRADQRGIIERRAKQAAEWAQTRR